MSRCTEAGAPRTTRDIAWRKIEGMDLTASTPDHDTVGTQTEALAFATELYTAVYGVARKHGKSYEEVVRILARTRDAGPSPRAA
jgi:hypothetical protein